MSSESADDAGLDTSPSPGRSAGKWWVLFLAAPPVLVGLWLLLDWAVAVPSDHPRQYVGREECRRCHEEELDLWTGSDHDLAMEPATPESVLGDFHDATFIRVPFERWGELGEEALRRLASRTEPARWALSLKTADAALRKKLLGMLPEPTADTVRRLMADRRVVRPSDAAYARYRIGREAARLIADGHIEAPQFQRSRLRQGAAGSGEGAAGIEYFAETEGPDGEPGRFRCAYTFGVRPLQQYLVPMPGGRYQCLPLAWDTTLDQWYHLYPNEPIPHDDELHWTGPLQNWNYMCADCHSTNLRKGYDVHSDTYHTTWSEIDVSCEACHGPSSLHVELADAWSPFWDRRQGYGLPSLKSDNPRVEIETCAPCHARRRIVYPGFKPGDRFLDHYMPELLDGNLYYADGQVLEENYVYGSFIQSRMYREQVRCTDCHDAHTGKTKFDDNALCGQCHVPAEYDTPQHHHHPDAEQPGTLCVECHMPETKYMVVDARRDHSLRVPRPDLTVSLGIPNACSLCHDDASEGETPQWAAQKCEEWYGPPEGPQHFAHAIAAGRAQQPEGRRMLQAVARRRDVSAMVRASVLVLLGNYPSAQPTSAQVEGLSDDEGLVRAAAAQSVQQCPPAVLQRYLPPLLDDPLRAVRTEAARLLSAVPREGLKEPQRRAFDRALDEYLAGQRYLGDQPAAHLNVAVVHSNLAEQQRRAGRQNEAQRLVRQALAQYETALRLDPQFVPAHINLGMLYYDLHQSGQAEQHLRRAIKLAPERAEPRYSLGLLLAENRRRLPEAARVLQQAAELAPGNPRIRYNLGLALQHLGRRDEAEAELRAAYELAPGNTDYLHALAILYAQQERWPRAVASAEELLRRQPDNPQWKRLLEQLRRQASPREQQ